MSIPWARAVPVIIFLGLIVPLWIAGHYITIWLRIRAEKNVGPLAQRDLEALHKVADSLEQRLHSLETILDSETPDWREK